jgi:aspartate kinase
MALVVQKFGGTSVADPDRMRAVAEQVALARRHGHQVVLVISAMGKETDDLLHLASQVSSRQAGREMDMLITAGERKATALLCMALHDQGVDAESYTGSQAGFLTDTNHTNAKILSLRPERLQQALDAGIVPVVGGSQGVSTDHNVTFLGRGGSDTTAVALASALGADVCELYTDVSGVFTADPRLVPTARRIPGISSDEMLEMCATGCPKPAMRSVEFARNHGVRLHVRSAFTWEPGTWIVDVPDDPDATAEQAETDDQDWTMEQAIIRAVTHDPSESKVTVHGVPDEPGIAARVFRRLAEQNVNVDMIVQNVSAEGVTDISFTMPKEDLEVGSRLADELAAQIGAAGVDTDERIARVSLVGAGMKSNPGVAARMFEVLAENSINIEMISTSAIRISCVVALDDMERAVVALHDAFDLGAVPRPDPT